ncbi:heavy metal-associated isoprenylated plant protein 3-like [Thalictrum thalictroides]|uniref:Heavy metal-associated isoprenylated plant protein 3-like n=1 Tax=Thalictrum thalictroides TaxID=46969 RepID=A0A7J6VEG2_THATH|nr:heavy metal-associated isoprenylated plant protein 3-like [Thalictrum thalictroides]
MGAEENKPEEKKVEEKKVEEEVKKPEEEKKPEEKEQVIITVVLKVHMHCEACAQEIQKRILRMKGVKTAEADLKSSQVTVTGVFDPPKLVEYVYKRTGKHAMIVKTEPEKKEEEEKSKEEKVEEKKEEAEKGDAEKKEGEEAKPAEEEAKKEEEAETTKVRIIGISGVKTAEADLKSSQVTVTGVFDPPKLVEYVYKRTGKHAMIVKTEPEKKEEEEKSKEEKVEEKKEEAEKGDAEKKEGEEAKPAEEEAKKEEEAETTKVVVELQKNEYYYYPPKYNMEYAYPPQIFSDENPNACSVM